MRTTTLVRSLLAASLVSSGLVALATGAAAETEKVLVADFFFESDHLEVTEGDTIVFSWVGQDPHTVTETSETPAFDSGIRYNGASYAVTFPEAGVYTYFCRIHPEMQGTVEVAPEDGTKLTGNDNVARALAWSQHAVADGGAGTALLGRADLFADSLASGGAQGQLGAPLLLTPSNSLDSRVKAELERIGANRVVILGGEAAISKAVEDELVGLRYAVDRVGGKDRIGTAKLIADRYFRTSDTAIVARAFGSGSQAYADALGAGAAAAKLGVPVLFTPTDKLSNTTKSYLSAAGVEKVYIAGGTAAVSQAVEDALKNLLNHTEDDPTVIRLGGSDRFATAELFTLEGFTFEEHEALLIDGSRTNTDAWASGFGAALAAARGGLPIVVDGDALPGFALSLLYDLVPAVVCGPDVSAAVCDEAATIASVPSVESREEGVMLGVATTASDPALEGHVVLMDLRRTKDPNTVCFSWFGDVGEDTIVATHVHVDDPANNNPTVVDTLGADAIDPNSGNVYGCQTLAAGVVDSLFADPDGYFWNVHFADDQGADAGTLRGPVFEREQAIFAGMVGELEVPPVDSDGEAFGFFFADANHADRICYGYGSFLFGEQGPTPLTGAHIHEGEQGVNGPVVIPLETPAAGHVFAGGCAEGLDPTLVDAIVADPEGYYVNLHTEEHPSGELRGQMFSFFSDHGTPDTPSSMAQAGAHAEA